jgi:endonuclease/exonuclease/phosphatase (EEP) superfamily protein YafD
MIKESEQSHPAPTAEESSLVGWLKWLAWGLLYLIGVLTLLATITGFLARLWWLFEPTSHFRAQYMFVLLAAAIIAAAGRRWLPAALFALAAMVNFILVIPVYLAGESVQEGASYRILMANVEYINEDEAAVLQMIGDVNPDILIVEEFTPAWQTTLEAISADYPHSELSPRTDAYGIALYSRLPYERSEIRTVGPSRFPSVFAWYELDGRPLTVVGTHPPPPLNKDDLEDRDQQLAAIIEYASAQSEATIVAGDFNVTTWSPIFQDMLFDSDLREARRGFGLHPTWPTSFLPLGVPFDHILVSPGVAVHNFGRGADTGSDHYPVFADFSIGP